MSEGETVSRASTAAENVCLYSVALERKIKRNVRSVTLPLCDVSIGST